MKYEHDNEELIKKAVKEVLKMEDPKDAEKWEKYLIYVMLN